MSPSSLRVEEMPSWRALAAHRRNIGIPRLNKLFEDPERFEKFHQKFQGIMIDFSKNWLTTETMSLLVALLQEADVATWAERMFSGQHINMTEDRAVLHVALRNRSERSFMVGGLDVMPEVRQTLSQMRLFSDAIRSGEWVGYTGKPITDVVNIGIGGSDLGPAMVTRALRVYGHSRIRPHFVSNIDGHHLQSVLDVINPETSLFIVASKTFTTQETLTNAESAKKWLLSHVNDPEQYSMSISRHFAALSTNSIEVKKFGILLKNMFPFWDWVGGRYSVWSSIGLSVAIYIGMDHFERLLMGAYEVDCHFLDNIRNAPLQCPSVILALIGIWYNNFFDAQTHVLLPYHQDMDRFAAYFQQGDMESNGKMIDRDGMRVNYSTGAIVWGEPGTNAQHSFFQLLHQGTRLIPADFLAVVKPSYSLPKCHHDMLMSNYFAQTEALAFGKGIEKVREELEVLGLEKSRCEQIAPHKVFEGNHPSTSIVINELDPYHLGALIAIYEHKIFVQGMIWRINPYDQWGVELGKQLAKNILPELERDGVVNSHDSSTNGLINHYKKLKVGSE